MSLGRGVDDLEQALAEDLDQALVAANRALVWRPW